jgi:hypothetical protein
MSLFKGLLEVALSPLNGVKEVIDDVSGNNEESEQGLAILTLGVSSLVKGTAKGIKKGTEDIFN